MSLTRARELAASLGKWAASDDAAEPEAPATEQAMRTADNLVFELLDAMRSAEAHRLWNLPGHPFARTGGKCLHARDCFYAVPELEWHQPLTRTQAEAFLRESHEHRRCAVCAPDIPGPPWVRLRSAGGRVRWRLADDVELPP